MGEYRVLMGVYVFFSLGYSLFNLFVRPVSLFYWTSLSKLRFIINVWVVYKVFNCR